MFNKCYKCGKELTTADGFQTGLCIECYWSENKIITTNNTKEVDNGC